MTIVRSPVRVSFVGGGTDIPDFYQQYTGRVISTAIQQYVWVAVNKTMDPKIVLKYRETEYADSPQELSHARVREALQDMRIEAPIEIVTLSDVTGRAGLGASSAFSCSLIRALNLFKSGHDVSGAHLAKLACWLEIDLVGEPIGKQDQYATAIGGFNVFQFNSDETVNIMPVSVSAELENYLLLFFTGMTRDAGSILAHQKKSADFNTLKQMSDSVFNFRNLLLAEDWFGAAKMLHEGWLRKKSLCDKISNSAIDVLYERGLEAGAWGGKVCGAGGGGCLLFIAPPEVHSNIRQAFNALQEIPVRFTDKGCEVIFQDRAL